MEVPHQIIYNQLARHLLNTCSNRCMHMHTPGNLLNMVQGRRFSSNWDDLVCDPQGCRLFNLAEFEYLFSHVNNNNNIIVHSVYNGHIIHRYLKADRLQTCAARMRMCGMGRGVAKFADAKPNKKRCRRDSHRCARSVDYDEYFPGVHCDSHSVGECH